MSNKHVFDKSISMVHCDYHDDTNTMEIGFKNSGVYHYPKIPKAIYEALKTAESPGKFFHDSIRTKHKGIKQG